MAWTTPRTWADGEVVTAALLNAQIRDNLDEVSPEALTATFVPQTDVAITPAGGVGATGDNVKIGDINAIASDVGTAQILGGGSVNRENVIGSANPANVNTASSNLPATTGTGADYSQIIGGYDNVNNGYACILNGYHNLVSDTASHATIAGGSIQVINGEYATIGGGAQNTVSGDYATIAGGDTNEITPDGDKGYIGGGSSNTISANGGAIMAGTSNTASGTNTTVGGGLSNTASGTTATVGGGGTNIASGNNSVVSGGTLNSATASGAAVLGGVDNDATQQGTTIGGGTLNDATGFYSTVVGGHTNAASGSYDTAIGRDAVSTRYGGLVQAAGKITTVGDAQTAVMVCRRQTTDATPNYLSTDGNTGRLTIANNSTVTFSALVSARRIAASGQSAGYKIEGLIRNNGGAVAFVGTPTVTVLGEDDATWDCSATANDTNNSLDIMVTGAASQTINWSGRVTLVEVAG